MFGILKTMYQIATPWNWTSDGTGNDDVWIEITAIVEFKYSQKE